MTYLCCINRLSNINELTGSILSVERKQRKQMNSYEFNYFSGINGPLRSDSSEGKARFLMSPKYRRSAFDAYGDLSAMMESIDRFQRPRFGRK
ncbi:hypothetical protein RB195_005347 [Necator americanus]|uniref:Uncharacterized protein n=1 Tax=Necator americanus TaxID=51031 RepID=A0ABR1BQK1_NECAM